MSKLEKVMKSCFLASPDKTFYFSREGKISSSPSKDHFLRADYTKKLERVFFSFQSFADWEDIEQFYDEPENNITVIHGCDIKRFKEISTELHTLNSPIDDNIIYYEADFRNDDEMLEVKSDDVFSARYFLNYTDFKNSREITYEYCPELGDEQPVPDYLKEILQSRRKNYYEMPNLTELVTLLGLSKEERNNLYNVYTKGNEFKEIMINEKEMERRVKEQIEFFYTLPFLVKSKKLKTEFNASKKHEVELFIVRMFNNTGEIYDDEYVDYEKDMIEAVKGGSMLSRDSLFYQIFYFLDACDVQGHISIDLLGEGQLESFIKNFG